MICSPGWIGQKIVFNRESMGAGQKSRLLPPTRSLFYTYCLRLLQSLFYTNRTFPLKYESKPLTNLLCGGVVGIVGIVGKSTMSLLLSGGTVHFQRNTQRCVCCIHFSPDKHHNEFQRPGI